MRMQEFGATVRRVRASACVPFVFLIALAGAADAEAQLPRAFVSTSGLDTSPCTRQQPCRSFGAALDVVNAGGEVIPLDTGGYGAFTIDKSVAVSSPSGVHAAISAFSGTAIVVQPGIGGKVVLRGLSLNAQGAVTGISFPSGDVLHVESCVVHGFSLDNLRVIRNVAGQPAELVVVDSTFRRSAIALGHGMLLQSAHDDSKIEATIFRSRFENNHSGVHIIGRVSLAAAYSVFATNVNGIHVEGASGTLRTDASIVSSQITNHLGAGLETVSGGGSVNAWIGKNTITGNIYGVLVGASTSVRSNQNNTIHGNTTADVSGTLLSLGSL